MSKANTGDEQLDGLLEEIFHRLRDLESPSTIRVPLFVADPTTPRNGQIWVNTTSNQLKVRIGGTTRATTLT